MSDLYRPDAIRWNPLEDGAMDDQVPLVWTGAHVGKRLVEGFQTLMKLPGVRGPKEFGAAWPAYSHDWADLLAQQEADDDQKAADQRSMNRARTRPSAIDVSRMEAALGWAPAYLRLWPGQCRVVQIVALALAFERDIEWVCRRQRWYEPTVRKTNHAGLERIAAGLNRGGVGTF